MGREPMPSSKPQVIHSSGRGEGKPDLRLLHYNDVYHVDQSSSEPVGGLARFITLCREYQEGSQYEGQSGLLTLFSGDAFNPSIESSVTKGRHMVPVLNAIKTDVACVGNHDFDFGVKQFESLSAKCNFPWLIANVLDPDLGENVPLGNAKRTHMLTTSNGVKVGFIGLGEREWLATINSLPPNLIYKSATETVKELVPKLREEGAEIVICLSHMREPNDLKLAEQTGGIIDIILGGHDHYYNHAVVGGTHVLRSGSDFKQLSYIEAKRKQDDPKRWDFDVWRRDVTSDIPEHEETAKLVAGLTSRLQKSLDRGVGWTAMPLDARFSTVRLRESNIGNFVCDVMRGYHKADCTIMAGGTIRGDQIYPPGVVRIKDIISCFPFEDPVVLLRAKGQAVWDALENGVSTYPALEGRFPQVSGLVFAFDPAREPGRRLLSLEIGGETYDPERKYLLATRGYMGRGKDGYDALLVKSEGGEVEEIVDEESGILISALLRQFFMALRTIGQWRNLSAHWFDVAEQTKHTQVTSPEELPKETQTTRLALGAAGEEEEGQQHDNPWRDFLRRRLGFHRRPDEQDEDRDDEHFDSDQGAATDGKDGEVEGHLRMDVEVLLMKKFWGRWVRRAGIKSGVCDGLSEAECAVDWTRVIAPRTEGRIKIVGQ